LKRMALCIVLLLLACGCTAPQTDVTAEVTQGASLDDEKGYTVKSFDYYRTGDSVFDTFEFLQNKADGKDRFLSVGEKFDFRFEGKDGELKLKYISASDKTQYYNLFGYFAYEHGFYPNEQCSDALAFLCDEEAIKECFSKNGVKDIREIVIWRLADYKTGYVASALTENDAYYMTVPIANAEHGNYIYQKVYTSEEFKKIYSPREADVYIDGKKMESPSVTLLGEKYLEMDLLSFLEALGYECEYDAKKLEISAGEYKIALKYNKKATELRKKYSEFIEPAPEYTVTIRTPEEKKKGYSAMLRNGRVLVGYECLEALCELLRYDCTYNYDDYSVHLDDRNSEVVLRDEINFYPYKLRDEIDGYKLKVLSYYHNEGSIYNTFEFLQNPFDERVYEESLYASSESALFKEVDGKLVLSAVPGHNETSHADLFSTSAMLESAYPNEHCSDALAFLCDEEAIKECFSKNGVKDISKVRILGFMDDEMPYIAVALTENDAYYMPVPIADAEHGDYTYQKVYTSEEFKKLYSPRAADVYIDGRKADFPSVTLLGESYLEMDLLGFLEALGYECEYDAKKQEISAGKYKIKLDYDEEWSSYGKKYAEFIEDAPRFELTIPELEPTSPSEWVTLRNERFLASKRLVEGFCYLSGYEIEYQYDDMSVHIFKK